MKRFGNVLLRLEVLSLRANNNKRSSGVRGDFYAFPRLTPGEGPARPGRVPAVPQRSPAQPRAGRQVFALIVYVGTQCLWWSAGQGPPGAIGGRFSLFG